MFGQYKLFDLLFELVGPFELCVILIELTKPLIFLYKYTFINVLKNFNFGLGFGHGLEHGLGHGQRHCFGLGHGFGHAHV